MTDFFAALAARNSGIATVLEPRPQSRFEQSAVSAGRDDFAERDVETTAPQRHSIHRRARTAGTPTAAPTRAETQPIEIPASGVPDSTASAPTRARVQDETGADVFPQSRTTVAPATGVSSQVPVHVEKGAAAGVLDGMPFVTRQHAVERASTGTGESTPPPAEVTSVARIEVEIDRWHATRPLFADMEQPTFDAPRIATPVVAQRRESASVEQTVNITIGRVEVRAATPAPVTTAPRVRSERAGVMPLDEYLRRRGSA